MPASLRDSRRSDRCRSVRRCVHEFETKNQKVRLKPVLDHLTARPPFDLGYSEDTDAELPRIAGCLSVALARSFNIIDPDLRNPRTPHWERSFRLFELLL